MYQTQYGASSALTDDEFLVHFESLTLPESGFRHVDHVRLAWICVQRDGLAGALNRVREGIKRFATHHGAPGKYHETLTCAAVILVNERIHRSEDGLDWRGFADANPDLLVWKGGAFFDHYPEAVVNSDEARRVFMLPRRDAAVIR